MLFNLLSPTSLVTFLVPLRARNLKESNCFLHFACCIKKKNSFTLSLLLILGLVSMKSKTNIMVKSVLDVCFGGIAYWFIGYGISFGLDKTESNPFSGDGHFLTDVDVKTEGQVYTKFFFQLSFASASTTIISGK